MYMYYIVAGGKSVYIISLNAHLGLETVVENASEWQELILSAVPHLFLFITELCLEQWVKRV